MSKKIIGVYPLFNTGGICVLLQEAVPASNLEYEWQPHEKAEDLYGLCDARGQTAWLPGHRVFRPAARWIQRLGVSAGHTEAWAGGQYRKNRSSPVSEETADGVKVHEQMEKTLCSI